MRSQPEKTLVLIPCLKACHALKEQGVIIQYRRLDALDHSHVNGSPDIEIMLSGDNDMTLWLLFVECKAPTGGVHLKSQKNYRDLFKGFANVRYVIVRSVEELRTHIEQITGFYERQLNELEKIRI